MIPGQIRNNLVQKHWRIISIECHELLNGSSHADAGYARHVHMLPGAHYDTHICHSEIATNLPRGVEGTTVK